MNLFIIIAGCSQSSPVTIDPDPSKTPVPTPSSTVTITTSGALIADHTVVDHYVSIPDAWINEVKKMWINIPGESHSAAYRKGFELLEAIDSRFAVKVVESGDPDPATDQYLRASRSVRSQYNSWGYGTGEDNFWTLDTAAVSIKNHITYCATNNLTIAAIGFGWCWDMTWGSTESPDLDPVYGCHWYGTSADGWWGLDEGDSTINCKTYCERITEYMTYCTDNGYATKVLFTTGTVDNYTGERGYQGYLKNEYIRGYVNQSADNILFDYADILCYNDAGELQEATWDSHTYPIIHPDNDAEDTGHISNAGAIRLAKAQWWLLARIAGWDGN